MAHRDVVDVECLDKARRVDGAGRVHAVAAQFGTRVALRRGSILGDGERGKREGKEGDGAEHHNSEAEWAVGLVAAKGDIRRGANGCSTGEDERTAQLI